MQVIQSIMQPKNELFERKVFILTIFIRSKNEMKSATWEITRHTRSQCQWKASGSVWKVKSYRLQYLQHTWYKSTKRYEPVHDVLFTVWVIKSHTAPYVHHSISKEPYYLLTKTCFYLQTAQTFVLVFYLRSFCETLCFAQRVSFPFSDEYCKT